MTVGFIYFAYKNQCDLQALIIRENVHDMKDLRLYFITGTAERF